MRLKKLQVSGFKSFVDATDIRLPSHLVGVVGPNGCGKSNVIDAVRWVMGESSAKMLRGDNMADVIFNGSSSRKPVGKASVELIFDNHDGQASGNYGRFAEISVKRTLTRDGQSIYQINNLKTRRKDVLDLFRGTGLGPRSYSIIEQGMVSRIIEARPEDLRVFVEEAAGTSKYKDRRKETESRIAHTRENLDRVADICDELGKTLRRLKRQSASARRYKKLKINERELNGQLHILRLNELNRQLEEQNRLTAKFENILQENLSSQRETESNIESIRKEQSDAHELNNQIQQEYYQVGAQITSIEQKIEHLQENRQRQGEEIDQLKRSKVEFQNQIETESSNESALKQKLDLITPELEANETKCCEAERQLENAEKILQDWLGEMERFNEQSREPAQQVEIQKSRITYLQQHQARAEQNRIRLNDQVKALKQEVFKMDVDSMRAEVAEQGNEYRLAESSFDETERKLKQLQITLEQKKEVAANDKARLQEATTRLESLQEIQLANLDEDNEELDSWLNRNGLGQVSKLANKIQVKDGWEKAADRVLNGFLNAVCVEEITEELLAGRPNSGLSVISENNAPQMSDRISLPRMLEKIEKGASYVSALITGVYAADSLDQGLKFQYQLSGGEYIVTRNGALIGANWVSFASQSQIETGMLVREDEIAQLKERKNQIQQKLKANEREISILDAERSKQDVEFSNQKSNLNELRTKLNSLHDRFGRKETRFIESQDQINKLVQEFNELAAQITTDNAEIENANALLDTAAQESGDLDQQREKLVGRKDELNSQVIESREKLNSVREIYHQKSLQRQKLEADIGTVKERANRCRNDLQKSENRLSQLLNSESTPDDTVPELEKKLEQLLEKKLEIDGRFSSARDKASGFDSKIDEAIEVRNTQINTVNDSRETLSQQKLTRQEVLVRRDTLVESINEQGFEESEIIDQLPSESNVEDWQTKMEEIERKIAKIGPVNLVAIEEFDEESERMDYLDKQHTDLTEALNILESVIRKIDRETRSRFRETFDKINTGFNQFFPKLFGGGSAELRLTSDDLLTAGIGVMARPPGKRNSHIHLLSGGEKALTAVALLFSLFELNPAPFCMLDEVDAPLDDANVDRYCKTLKTLANKSQMIVITHNKITMEAMDLLVGVTMAEAGVSRLVSVDIDQAVEMAAQ